MKKLNKETKEAILKALQDEFDIALSQDKRLALFINSKPTYLGSEKFFERVLLKIDSRLKLDK